MTFTVMFNTLLELWSEFWAYVENLEFSQMPFKKIHSTLPCKNFPLTVSLVFLPKNSLGHPSHCRLSNWTLSLIWSLIFSISILFSSISCLILIMMPLLCSIFSSRKCSSFAFETSFAASASISSFNYKKIVRWDR